MAAEAENDCARFWLEDGMVRCVVKPVAQTTEQALDCMRLFTQVAGDKKRPAVIDTSRVKGLSREARAIYSGPEAAKIWTACALVVSHSAVARMLGNFVIAVGRPAFPTRIFDSLDEALAWAREHIEAD
jgi:hypothetical protein